MLALPWYGKAWSTETDEARSADDQRPGHRQPVRSLLRGRGGVRGAVHGRRYEPDQASAWTSYPDQQCSTCPAVWRQVWYDDPDGFGAKIDYALEQQLAGVGIWAMGMDAGREEMWLTLRDRLRPQLDVTAPGGSAQPGARRPARRLRGPRSSSREAHRCACSRTTARRVVAWPWLGIGRSRVPTRAGQLTDGSDLSSHRSHRVSAR